MPALHKVAKQKGEKGNIPIVFTTCIITHAICTHYTHWFLLYTCTVWYSNMIVSHIVNASLVVASIWFAERTFYWANQHRMSTWKHFHTRSGLTSMQSQKFKENVPLSPSPLFVSSWARGQYIPKPYDHKRMLMLLNDTGDNCMLI